jgi:hypothetical protein
MTVPAASQQAKSALREELEDLGAQLRRLGNCLLNQVFDLTEDGLRRRGLILLVLFLGLGFILTLASQPLEDWGDQFVRLVQYLLNGSFRQQFPDTLTRFLSFILGAVFGPQTLRYLPVFILPFLIALESAAKYLDDIFELEQVDIAREFILSVALTGGYEKIHIGKGQVAEQDRKSSTIFLIGGPGQALVELDSVALFEKPDGTPHIIDSSPGSNKSLEAFERYRWSFDLRDQFLDLSEKDNSSVTSRSLDGIRIQATDVRLLYRLRRDRQPASLGRPHPFEDEAVYSLVYNEARPVTPGGVMLGRTGTPKSSTGQTDLQMEVIVSLIRTELEKFMSRYKLTRYLASHGAPEFENAREREEKIVEISRSVADPDDPAEPQKVSPPPEFEPRPRITSLFTEFTNEFTANASESGVELHWIGVGTWNPPDKIVPENHIEAWRLSLENLARSSEGALKALGHDKKIQEKIRLIQTVPLGRFREDSTNGKDHKFVIKNLLIAYRQQLVEIKELLDKSKRTVPDEIKFAIQYLDNAIGHWL